MIKWQENQLKAIKEAGNLLVSASAGSGKTTVMIERILRLIKEGINIRRLLVITFTKASAQDMKEKIINKLYEEMQLNPSPIIKAQIELLPFCNISTIDSFFNDLYNQFFEEIGLSPNLSIIEEEDAKALFNEAVDEIISAYLATDDEIFHDLLSKFTERRRIDKLKSEFSGLNAFLSAQLDKNSFLQKHIEEKDFLQKSKSYFFGYYSKQAARLKEKGDSLILQAKALKYDKAIIEHLEYLVSLINEINFFTTFEDYLTCNIFDEKIKSTPKRKADIDEKLFKDDSLTPFKKDLKSLFGKISETLKTLKNTTDYDNTINHKLIEATLRIEKLYSEKKLEAEKIDFRDLSAIAIEVLKKDSRAKLVASQYDYIFVDEYQDTNDLQELIINRIQSAGNLFMVGDAKQSIYGFRNAEPAIFTNRFKEYTSRKNGINIPMNDNFRSCNSILNFANAFFSPLMTEDFGGVDYKEHALLKSGFSDDLEKVSELPYCSVYLFELQEKENLLLPEIYSVKEDDYTQIENDNLESLFIADKIHGLVGKEYILDTITKEKRLIQYSDIAIIMRNKTDRGLLFALKSYNIPFKAVKFDKDKRNVELDNLINYLKIIDNLHNDIALAGIMKSFIFNFSDDDMLKIRNTSCNNFFYQSVLNYSKNDNIKIKIDKMLSDISRYKILSHTKSVMELLGDILTYYNYDAYIMNKEKGDEDIEYINAFIINLEDKDYAKNITDFLNYYDEIFSGEISLPAKQENLVNIMTIHNSKGLEFPVVFIAHFETGFSHIHYSKSNLLYDKEFGIASKIFNPDTMQKSDSFRLSMIKLKKAMQEKEELLRLIYVAITRAKNHLFISGKNLELKAENKEEMNSPVEWLKYSAKTNPCLSQAITVIKSKEDLKLNGYIEIEKKKLKLTPLSDLSLTNLDLNYKHKNATEYAQKYSVSYFSSFTEEDDKLTYLPFLPSHSRETGTIYHKILEHIDFESTSLNRINDELLILVKKGILTEKELHSIDKTIIFNTLNSSLWSKIRESKYYREYPFMLYVPLMEVEPSMDIEDKILLQGVCDLLVLGEENIIIDYKFTNLDTQSIIKRYYNQLKLYAMAIEKIKNINIHRKIVYVINRNEVLNFNLD